MPQRQIDEDVFSAALGRMMGLYEDGHTVVVSFSGGKDSTCALEIAREACRRLGIPKVTVSMRDEEIMLPGTFEYCERVAAEPDIDFHWWVAGQPIVNAFNRAHPYYWVFDQELSPEQWMRRPPAIAKVAPSMNIEHIVSSEHFPTAPGKDLFAVVGLRSAESRNRRMGIQSSRGWLTNMGKTHRKARPIYDWEDSDVWRAISVNGWDYNRAYDGMMRGGLSHKYMRIAPPALSAASMNMLMMASKVWPAWFEKLCIRLPGLRTAAQFGARSITPYRRVGETWEAAFWRTCVDTAPPWIAERAAQAAKVLTERHAAHATSPYPEVQPCTRCSGPSSWRALAFALYHGDPFCLKVGRILTYVEPEFFRPGAGTWGGKPTW